MATKNAVASDNCPVTPTSSVSPIAPIAALMANRPVCSQKAWAYCGSQSRNAASTIQPARRTQGLDTGLLPRSEEAPRPPQQDREQHDVGHHVRQAPAQEGQLVLIAGRQGLGCPDEQAGDQCAGGRVEPAEHGD